MSRRIQSEEAILNTEIRKQIIDEIVDGQENITRKFDELVKHEVYRDRSGFHVMQQLRREVSQERTLAQMQNRITNISIAKKITNKLAQTYTGGVDRRVEDDPSQESINALVKELDVDSTMRKSDRFRQLFRNSLLQAVPVRVTDTDLWRLMLRVFAPHEYDVIEDPNDRTQPMVVILTDFVERHQEIDQFGFFGFDQVAGSQGRRIFRGTSPQNFRSGDQRQQKIADSPADEGTEDRRLIWWSKNFHFTTNEKGDIIDAVSDKAENPIQMMPFINVTGDQDGHFWARGGEDVVQGDLSLNKQATDIKFISYVQGWGQMVITAKDVPKVLEGGPNNAFVFEHKDGDPAPAVFFASSSPQISQMLETMRSELAMLLSTNDLSTRNIQSKLDATDPASGIARLIEQSESTADIQDTQQLYRDKEPIMWEIIRRWHEKFHENLIPDQSAIPKFVDSDVALKFMSTKPVISEGEHLENLTKRKALGLDRAIDLMIRDNPDLNEEMATERLEEIKAEKQENAARFMQNLGGDNGEIPKAEEEESESETEEEGE